jgi:hypothetical protein
VAVDRPGAIRVSGMEAVERLRDAQGEVLNVLTAALRDLAKATVEEPDEGVRDNWPVARVNGGTSRAGWYWQVADGGAYIGNPVEYVPFVWSNLLVDPIEDYWIIAIEASLLPKLDDVEAAISARVRELLEGP